MTVAAIILAAGMSTRMGAQKQLLRIGTKTLLEHTIGNVRASPVSEIVLVLGAAAEAIREQIANDDLKIVTNEAFRAGMGTSLQKGLAALDPGSQAALIVLADQPMVRPATIEQMIDAYRQHHPQILIPLYRGFRGNPVLLDRSVFPEIAALNGDVGCRAIFGDHLENILKLPVDDPGVLLDVDSEDDLENLRRFCAQGSIEIPLVETSEPADPSTPQLVVVGREAVAVALAKLGRVLEFSVVVVDPLLERRELPEANTILRTLDFAKLPEARARFAVVASLGRFDEEAVEQALVAGIPYVALLANKRRAQEVLRSLALKGFDGERLKSVRAPAGLAISAVTPQEIALSIMAEIISEYRGSQYRRTGRQPATQ